MIVGLFYSFRRVLRGFSLLDAIPANLDIAPTGAFLLYFVEDFLWDNCFVILLRSISVYLAVIGLPLRLVFWCVGFEDNSGAVVFRIGISCTITSALRMSKRKNLLSVSNECFPDRILRQTCWYNKIHKM
jgi:hypothetical protein